VYYDRTNIPAMIMLRSIMELANCPLDAPFFETWSGSALLLFGRELGAEVGTAELLLKGTSVAIAGPFVELGINPIIPVS
jgi:hypothetical protein